MGHENTTSGGSLNLPSSEIKQVCEVCTVYQKKPVNIDFYIFFDGTNNNKYNVKKGVKGKYEDGDSYEQDYTNIVHLYEFMVSSESIQYRTVTRARKHIYIEGVGTSTSDYNVYKEDSTVRGKGLNAGPTNIENKTKNALKEIVGFLENFKIEPLEYIADISIDVFGFSRGAATARYFLSIWNLISENIGKSSLNNLYLRVDGVNAQTVFKLSKFFMTENNAKLKVGFVGLYDTVVSDGAYHGDDATAMKQKIKNAEKVFHIIAADEYRWNFQLTSILSKNELSCLSTEEISLPGSHSDVGGGYLNRQGEVGIKLSPKTQLLEVFNKYYNFYFNRGFFKLTSDYIKKVEDRHAITREGRRIYIGKEYTLFGSRQMTYNFYSVIPLLVMAQEYFNFKNFNAFEEFNEMHTIGGWAVYTSGELYEVQMIIKHLIVIYDFVKNNKMHDWISEYNPKSEAVAESIKYVRNKCIHISHRVGDLVNCPEETNSDAKNKISIGKRKVHYV